MNDVADKLAARLEQRARANLALAMERLTETNIDLQAIDFALACNERAKALRTADFGEAPAHD